MAAMVMERRTVNGAATFSGMQKASRGTATKASPKPNAERISVARKRIKTTSKAMTLMAYSATSEIYQRRGGASAGRNSEPESYFLTGYTAGDGRRRRAVVYTLAP